VEEIDWSVSGQDILTVFIEEGVAQVQAPSGWTGQETLRFSACDRWDRCATDEANFIRFDEDDLLIGFFGIDGFIIAHRGQHILIDALIAEDLVVDPLIAETLLGGQPPLEVLDVMLITHDHHDHFEPSSVLQFLRSHPETEVVSTSQVVDTLMSLLETDDPLRERIQAVEFGGGDETSLTVNQVRISIFDLPHPGSDRRENHGFILHLGDLNLLHTGDLDFNSGPIDAYPFGGYPVDYAFLPTIMVNAQTYPAIQEWLGEGRLVPMHYSTTGQYASLTATALQEIRGWFPDSIVFSHELQYWLSP
jgi:L-ascorbate metabolism protein UlaG (beta-lactamase superfamily)